MAASIMLFCENHSKKKK